MRPYARWITSLLLATMFVLAVAGSATAQEPAKKKATPVSKQASHSKTTAAASLISRVKAPKPVSKMSLAEVERFQTKALAHYTGMWHTWLKIKPSRKSEVSPKSGQWIMVRCNGAVAPVWACWNLQARGWTKLELAKTQKRIYVREHTLPVINDWLTAIRWVQQIYPGTYDWLYSISDREGCNTPSDCPWVWYGGHRWTGYHIGDDFLGADTVGGPMQFRYSTFAPYWTGAQVDLVKRGYIIPQFKMPPAGGDPKYAAWLAPMGQALTAAFMRYTGRDGCHWCL